jgi:hypothetical protein
MKLKIFSFMISTLRSLLLPYLITLSARARTLGGIVRPITLCSALTVTLEFSGEPSEPGVAAKRRHWKGLLCHS